MNLIYCLNEEDFLVTDEKVVYGVFKEIDVKVVMFRGWKRGNVFIIT